MNKSRFDRTEKRLIKIIVYFPHYRYRVQYALQCAPIILFYILLF